MKTKHSIFGLVVGLLVLGAFGTSPVAAQVCELKVDGKVDRVVKSLHLETYNDDPNLGDIWQALFGVDPGMSLDDILTLQDDQTVTWKAGTLKMGGDMKLKVKTDKKDPGSKEIKIEKAGKHDGTTTFISGTSGVNPNLANGGWHEVKIKDIDGVTVDFGSGVISGFLKELKIKLDRDSTTADPMVRDFKLKLKAVTAIPDVKKGMVTSA